MCQIAIKCHEQMLPWQAIHLEKLSDIKPTNQGPCCHHPSSLVYDRWTTSIKGRASTAHTVLYLQTSMPILKGQVHVRDATNISKPSSDGKGAKRQVKDVTTSCIPNPLCRLFRILVTWCWSETTASHGSTLNNQTGEGPRLGDLTEAHVYIYIYIYIYILDIHDL